MNTTLKKAIEHHKAEQQLRHEFAGPLAWKLAEALHLEKGDELVSIIGIGNEHDNLEALESWVFTVCSHFKLSFNHHHFDTLLCMLSTVLGNAGSAKSNSSNHK